MTRMNTSQKLSFNGSIFGTPHLTLQVHQPASYWALDLLRPAGGGGGGRVNTPIYLGRCTLEKKTKSGVQKLDKNHYETVSSHVLAQAKTSFLPSFNRWDAMMRGCRVVRIAHAPCWGGGGVWTPPPPLRFFEDSEKTAARSAAGFSPTLPPIFSATFVKISTQCHVRSGHQVRSSDPTTK